MYKNIASGVRALFTCISLSLAETAVSPQNKETTDLKLESLMVAPNRMPATLLRPAPLDCRTLSTLSVDCDVDPATERETFFVCWHGCTIDWMSGRVLRADVGASRFINVIKARSEEDASDRGANEDREEPSYSGKMVAVKKWMYRASGEHLHDVCRQPHKTGNFKFVVGTTAATTSTSVTALFGRSSSTCDTSGGITRFMATLPATCTINAGLKNECNVVACATSSTVAATGLAQAPCRLLSLKVTIGLTVRRRRAGTRRRTAPTPRSTYGVTTNKTYGPAMHCNEADHPSNQGEKVQKKGKE
ncbi:hypothetical protein DFJ73DRAFT_766229 [Zopfochytrium polystomum]|nr:hypothetical protein DFJ73DRAFT_766229 [Zopfochytrium polystomum]